MNNREGLDSLKSLHISSSMDDDDGDGLPAFEVDDDLEEEEEDEVPVTLGFVRKPQHGWSLLREMFPSKAGGVPAWLDPVNLPSGKTSLCDICEEPLQFLLQDQHEQWKRHPEKARRSVKVLRCQLPRSNSFYSSEPPRQDGTDQPLGAGAPVCSWCGTWKGDKVCSNCRTSRYCSGKHQAVHWKAGHKIQCRVSNIAPQTSNSSSINSSSQLQKASSNTLWPEFEIVNEDESEFDANTAETHGYAESLLDNNEDDADKKSWDSFCKRISRAPEQVLRYSSDAISKPLWPMSSGQPSNSDIPKCTSCGSCRAFEFQILPQLIYYLGGNDVDSLDWATIVVYTCEDSCDRSSAYAEEFAWVQLASQSTTPISRR